MWFFESVDDADASTFSHFSIIFKFSTVHPFFQQFQLSCLTPSTNFDLFWSFYFYNVHLWLLVLLIFQNIPGHFSYFFNNFLAFMLNSFYNVWPILDILLLQCSAFSSYFCFHSAIQHSTLHFLLEMQLLLVGWML